MKQGTESDLLKYMVVNSGTFLKVSIVQIIMCIFSIVMEELAHGDVYKDRVDYILDK